jgi:hypothetical protein
MRLKAKFGIVVHGMKCFVSTVSENKRNEIKEKVRLKKYEAVSISFRTGPVERELQMVQLSATRCSCIAVL